MMFYSFLFFNSLNGSITGAEYEINCVYISSYLRSKGILSHQLIYPFDVTAPSLQDLIKHICASAQGTHLVIYVNEYNCFFSSIVLKLLKKTYTFPIIIIGSSVSDIIVDQKDDFPADCYVLSDPFYALMDIADSGCLPLIYFSSKKIALSLIPHPYSNGTVPAREISNIGLYSSRGCMGKCVFCSYSTSSEIETYSLESIRDELLFIYHKVGRLFTTIAFLDDCFSITRERVLQLCIMIAEMDLPYQFWCTTRADLLSNEVLDALKRANFSISVGLESASPRLLASIGKTGAISANEYISLVAHLAKYAQSIELPFLTTVMFGLPGEEQRDIMQTFQFIRENNIADISYNFMTIFTNSRIKKNYEKTGYLKRSSYGKTLRTFYSAITFSFLVRQMYNIEGFCNQFLYTSKISTRRAKFLEYYTGIIPLFPTKPPHYLKNITIYFDNDFSFKELQESVCIDANYFVICSQIHRTKTFFSDDRKNIKELIPEYDSVMQKFEDNGVYCENLFFIWRDGNNLKCKCGDYFEKTLLSVPAISADSENIESYLLEQYVLFMSQSTFRYQDILPFCFKNANLFTNNGRHDNELSAIFHQCPRLSEVIEIAAFIAKNPDFFYESFSIYCSETLPEFFRIHYYLDRVFIILTNQPGVGFLYQPNERRHVYLNVTEAFQIKLAIKTQKNLENYPQIYRTVRHFIDISES